MTDPNDILARFERYTGLLREANHLNKETIFRVLADAKIDTVTVTFDGASDDGQIQDVNAFALGGSPDATPEAKVEFRQADMGAVDLRTVRLPLIEAIENLCYDCLTERHDGWEINDGAFGEFTFHIAERRLSLAFNARFSDFVTSNDSF